MSTRYEKFLPEVIPYVHDCPEFVAVNAIRNACIEFCDSSHWLLYEMDPVSTQAYQNLYELDLPDDTTLCRITEMWYDNLLMKPRDEETLRQMYLYDWRQVEGRPEFYTQLNQDEFWIVPMPNISMDNSLRVIVAIKPTRSSYSCDDSLLEWAEQIGYGARARLHEIPNQPFFDMGLAAACRVKFDAAIGQAKQDRNRGLTRATVRVRPPRFF